MAYHCVSPFFYLQKMLSRILLATELFRSGKTKLITTDNTASNLVQVQRGQLKHKAGLTVGATDLNTAP